MAKAARPARAGRAPAQAWDAEVERARIAVSETRERLEKRSPPDPARSGATCSRRPQITAASKSRRRVGCGPTGVAAARRGAPSTEGARINMVTAIRRTLEHELAVNPRVLVFGEDVGPQGRRACRDARSAGEFRRRARVRHEPFRRGHYRPRGRHGAGGSRAGARNPVSQICRSGDGTAQRLRHDAVAHRQPLCSAHRGAHAGRFFQMRRSLAQPDATKFSSCMASGGGWPCRRMREDAVGLLARGAARQRSRDFLRASRDARCAWARRPYPGDDFVLPFGNARQLRSGDDAYDRHLGRDGRALRASAAAPGSTRTYSTCAR